MADIRFAANCWATGVIVSNEEKFGNPYGPPELLALRPESERAAICQALAERVQEETQQLLARAGAGPPSDYGGFPVRQTATGSWEETPTVIFAEPASQPNSTDSSASDARRFQVIAPATLHIPAYLFTKLVKLLLVGRHILSQHSYDVAPEGVQLPLLAHQAHAGNVGLELLVGALQLFREDIQLVGCQAVYFSHQQGGTLLVRQPEGFDHPFQGYHLVFEEGLRLVHPSQEQVDGP